MLLHPGELLHKVTENVWAPTFLFSIAFAVERLLRLRKLRVGWLTLSWIMTAVLTAAALTYLFIPVLFEDAETDIACVSALVLRGQPLYPAMDAEQRYILLYGPATYLAHVPFYWLFGENLIAFKLLGVCAFLVSMVGMYRICRRYSSPSAAMVGLGCANVILFRYIGVEFWGRIDPLLLLIIVLPIWATLGAPQRLVVAANALAFAIAPNLKASAIAYLLPVAGLLLIRKGWRVTVTAIALGIVLFPVPFLWPQVSAANYVQTLQAAAAHGLVPEFLLRNLQYSALMLAPAVAVLWWNNTPPSGAHKSYFVLILAGLLATCVLGAKSGAGSYHLIPFVVPTLHLYFWRRGELPNTNADRAFATFAVAWVITTIVLSDQHLRTVWHEFQFARNGAASIEEVHRAEALYRGHTLAVGIGAGFDDPRTRYAFDPVFRGQPLLINGAAIRDLQFGGVPIPESTIQSIARCQTEVWLIPHAQDPFTAGNSYYDRFHPAFDDAFRQTFLSHYRKAEQGEMYDAWTCLR